VKSEKWKTKGIKYQITNDKIQINDNEINLNSQNRVSSLHVLKIDHCDLFEICCLNFDYLPICRHLDFSLFTILHALCLTELSCVMTL